MSVRRCRQHLLKTSTKGKDEKERHLNSVSDGQLHPSSLRIWFVILCDCVLLRKDCCRGSETLQAAYCTLTASVNHSHSEGGSDPSKEGDCSLLGHPVSRHGSVVFAVTSGCPQKQGGCHHLQRERDEGKVEGPAHGALHHFWWW